MIKNVKSAAGAAALAALLLAGAAGAQAPPQDGYQLPPQAIMDILDSPPSPQVRVSPNGQWLTIAERAIDEQTIAELAEPILMLAGRRFKQYPDSRIENTGITRLILRNLEGESEHVLLPPADGHIGEFTWAGAAANGAMLAYTTIHDGGMQLHWFDADHGRSKVIATPGLAGKIAGLDFSLDGRHLAFTATRGNEQALWLADVSAGTARAVTGVNLNHVIATRCSWIRGGLPLICTATVVDRGGPPVADEVPKGPIVQESYGRAAAVRTYQNLLKTPHDEALFDYYFTSQVVSVAADGKVTKIGQPGVYMVVSPAPGGEYLLVASLHRPYSYQVPLAQFPRQTAVWDRSGTEVRVVRNAPLIDNMSSARDATVPGVRIIDWRPDAPATLMLVEALDGGDPERAVPKRDRVSLLAAPFDKAPVTFAETEMRFGGIRWAFADLTLLTEYSSRTARVRTWIVNPARPQAVRKLWDLSTEDRYADPGDLVMVEHPTEPRQMPLRSADGRWLYLSGAGDAPDGARPFLDRLDIRTLKTERLWQSAPPHYERMVEVLDPQARRIVITRESPTRWPDYFLRQVGTDGDLRQLTELPDPAPWFAQVKGELIRYHRDDGIELSATLYLPPGYDAQRDGALPFFFWAYPREFLTAAGASQVSGSPYEFKRPSRRDHLMLLAHGYGVLDGPAMPIVAIAGGEPNDGYVEQLVAGARAAVDTLVERGVADRSRIGIGGHSYGAFMTGNLLAHSDLFRAGIARSGAYNRTLTPFGFQAEPRTYWQAPEVYNQMSPFMHAEKIDEPLLLIHGMRDSNSGTFPVQSERMFAAVKGNGGTIRYVQLPLEDHGYRARESRRHVLWEMVNWLDRYVRKGGPRS